jgi:hypothetical protein
MFPLLAASLIGLIWLYQFLYESRARRVLQLSFVKVAMVILMILYIAIAPGAGGQPFIYFQF